MSLDERRLLGCVYVDPPDHAGVNAEVWYWARQSELASGLEPELESFLQIWLATAWPFTKITLNGVETTLNHAGA